MAIYIRYTATKYECLHKMPYNLYKRFFADRFSIELVHYLPWPIKLCSIVRLRETTHLISIIRTKMKIPLPYENVDFVDYPLAIYTYD